MREKGEKKGGGIQVIYPRTKQLRIEKVENKNKNLLELEGEIRGFDLKMIIVYFDTKNYGQGRTRNNELSKLIESRIENNDRTGLIIMGDFNGHMKLLDNKKDDGNGKRVMRWMDEYNLTLLNLDQNCKGIYTWRNKDQKSAIDFILVNEKLYEKFNEMNIDEDREIIDLSDHSLLSAEFTFHNTNRVKEKVEISKEYFRKDKEALKNFKSKVENMWQEQEPESIEMMDESMIKEQDNA